VIALSRRAWVALAVLAQAAIVPVAVSGQVSARLTGTEFQARVEPVDPMDPFRGAYVALSYPGLISTQEPLPPGDIYIPLIRGQGALVTGGAVTATRPSAGPYLACRSNGRVRCGIESLFLPQGRASEVGQAVADGTAVARIAVDSRGRAALIEVVTGR